MSDPFIAEIRIFAGNFAPRGWAFCDGTLLAISQNTALFSLVGTTYGGNGDTNFAIPNLRDRAPMHPGTGPGLTPRRLGETGGADTTTLTLAEMPSHTHELEPSAGAPETSSPAGAAPAGGAIFSNAGGEPLAPMSSDAVESTGAGAAMENRQPLLEMNFIIALTGTYPSRS